jgi:ComF family protein
MVSLVDLLLPPACASCGRAGSVLCDRCTGVMAAPDPGAFVVADAGVVMGSALVLGIGALAFDGPVRSALSRLKYAGASRVAGPLASVAGPAFDRLLLVSGPAALVPVPVHPERRRQRGYNQASLLAAALAGPRRLAVVELLERRAATIQQHRLDRAARLANLRDAIAVRAGASLPVPPVAIVVDDILTTSATLEACASVLVAAGVGAVYGFAVAREV